VENAYSLFIECADHSLGIQSNSLRSFSLGRTPSPRWRQADTKHIGAGKSLIAQKSMCGNDQNTGNIRVAWNTQWPTKYLTWNAAA